MKKEMVVTLDNNNQYLILDTAKINDEEYIYCVRLDEEENPTSEYCYLKSIIEEGEKYLEEIEDQTILETLISLFTANYVVQTLDEEQAV